MLSCCGTDFMHSEPGEAAGPGLGKQPCPGALPPGPALLLSLTMSMATCEIPENS